MSSYARQRYANKSVLRASYLGSQHDANRSPTAAPARAPPALDRYLLFALLLNNDLEDSDLCGFCCGVCCCYLRVNRLQTDTARQRRNYLRVKLDIND